MTCNVGNSNHGSADGNTFIAYKSDIKGVMGGHSDNDMAGGSASVSNNTVIIVGSKTGLKTFMVNGGRVPTIKGNENYKEKIQAGKANNNRVILVGKGGVWSGEVNYGSAQPQRMAFANTGDSALAPKIDNVGVGVANGESKGNRLDIYGTGTEIGIIQNDMVQSVNFYIQKGLNPSENMLNVITCFGEDTIYINEAGKYSTGTMKSHVIAGLNLLKTFRKILCSLGNLFYGQWRDALNVCPKHIIADILVRLLFRQ